MVQDETISGGLTLSRARERAVGRGTILRATAP